MSGPDLGNSITALIAVIAGIAFIYFVVASAAGSTKAQPRYSFRRSYRQGFDSRDVGQQMHAVMAASFEKKRLLNSSEYRVFKIIEDDLVVSRSGYRVFAQTSLGEILTTPDKTDRNGYFSINSKRVDMLIVDRGGWPVAAIEYQGSGHFQGNAAARDAVKKEALRKAGVRYIEVSEADSAEQIRYRVREQLSWNASQPAHREENSQPVVSPPSFGRRSEGASSEMKNRAIAQTTPLR